ncbi:MAG: hypothetical protein A2Y63_05645 [Candidatus Riflebacteria bacterium RBG_13_59_9]|nr:MAG: hypothetical protein A2Y63_05645 [Candidatus Riflebacteria bacterium RBG_13_59_9]
MATPSTANYIIGKGILSFDRWDQDGLPTGMRDLGNAPNFTITPTVEMLDHFSSREQLKKKDLTVNISAGLTVKFTLDEFDKENLAIALFGTVSGQQITLMADTVLRGHLRFIGNPAAGPRFRVELWKVSLKPTSEVPFISEEWATVEFDGTVEADDTGHPSQPYGYIEQFWTS